MSEKRKYCGHCQEFVTLGTYRRHEKLFFLKEKGIWKTCDSSSDEEQLRNDHDSNEVESQGCCEGEGETRKEVDPIQDSSCHEIPRFSDEEFPANDSSDDDHWFKECPAAFNPEIWDISEEDVNGDFTESIPHVETGYVNLTHDSLKSILRWALIFLFLWAAHCSISDAALELLLAFIRVMFDVLGSIFPPLAVFTLLLPKTILGLRKYLGLEKDKFTKFVVCRSCSSLYTFDECHATINGKRLTKKCVHVPFPHHRQVQRRTPCNEPLLKEVILNNGKVHLYPFKVFCYKSITETLVQFIRRPGFAHKCELWRNRDMPNGFLADIFDGRVWRDWQYVESQPFLAASKNYALMLNVDWFQPFKHSMYSVGAMYLVIMNLPRSERFKPENVILVGLMPGPKESKLNINSYLKPLVSELNLLWTVGINVVPHNSSKTEVFHAALLCVACDLPAVRKVCGFTGHSSHCGCSKCTKTFPGVVGKMDYSGFEPSFPRNNSDHREQAQIILNETSATDQAAAEQRFGTRFSELMMLPYFDCVRYHVVDPMHNLFLGTSKHLMKNIWLGGENPVITKRDLVKIQSKLDIIKAPSSIGRMPRKIENSYGGFTADQWKTWTIIFSVFGLWDLLPASHMNVWHNFVMACSYFCSPVITESRANVGHSYILKFCEGFQNLYGRERVTPNMHMHTHILDCILDYGPVYSFWLFSFERYNGLMGDTITNQRSVEIQLMRKFTAEQFVKDLEPPTEFKEFFQPILEKLVSKNSGAVLVSSQDCPSKKVIETSLLALGPVRKNDERWKVCQEDQLYELCYPYSQECLEIEDLPLLIGAYSAIFDELNDASVTRNFNRYSAIKFAGEFFGSCNSRGERSCFIMARWCSLGGCVDNDGLDLRPGVVDYYLQQNVEVNGQRCACVFAAVRWFTVHPQRHRIGLPAEVWCRNVFELEGSASFIPVQRIFCRFVPAYDIIDREHVLVVCPVPRKFQC